MNILNLGYASTNYYLIGNSPRFWLVDVGWPRTLPKLRHNLQKYDFSFKNLACLLVTHYHPDHAGLVEEVKQQGVKLIVLQSQTQALVDLAKYMKPKDHFVEITLSGNINLQTDDSRNFLASYGLAGQIISTPGHSDDSVSLVLDDGQAFIGDLHPQEFATEDQLSQTTESWHKIRQLNVRTIHPGHGPARQLR